MQWGYSDRCKDIGKEPKEWQGNKIIYLYIIKESENFG